MHGVKEFYNRLLVKLLLEAGMRRYVTMPLFIVEITMLSLFGENGSVQRALMISASAATTAGFLKAPADLGAVSSLESMVQPIN